MEKPLLEKEYCLQKFPGKGGWTFAEIMEVSPDKHSHFGWVKVKGKIDDYEFHDYRLQPMGNGRLFFPVKAEIRKKIKKEAGDFVKIILYKDETALQIPDEIIACLKIEEKAYFEFSKLNESEQRQYLKWIYAPKTDKTKALRINILIENMLKEKKFNQKNE
ncbi:MAG: YdeI/OmpD-associated family protein [Bacteroidota bacterium]|nr:YdeI/OmpD-associated family protein [Bacteroidota bacterium]